MVKESSGTVPASLHGASSVDDASSSPECLLLVAQLGNAYALAHLP